MTARDLVCPHLPKLTRSAWALQRVTAFLHIGWIGVDENGASTVRARRPPAEIRALLTNPC